MGNEPSSPQSTPEGSPFEPYQPDPNTSQCSATLLNLQLIRLDTRYYPAWGKESHQASRTAGMLLVDGHFMSDTIEDYDYGWDENTLENEIHLFKGDGTKGNPGIIDFRTSKLYRGRTAIPSGEYYVTLKSGGKFGHDALMVSKEFGNDKIPGFTGVRIHAGKHSGFTEGCILVGVNSKNSENQFVSYDSLPFNKAKLGGRGNPKWTPNWLQNIIRLNSGMAKLTVRRNYPSQALCDREEQKKYELQCLSKLKNHRNDTLILNNYGLLNSPSFSVYKPFLPAKPGGKNR